MGAMQDCCALHLFTKAAAWKGHTTYCPNCLTLLVLRGGEWRAG